MKRAPNWLAATLACAASITLMACAPMRPPTTNSNGNDVRAPRTGTAARTPPRSVEFIASGVPSWFTYGDQAGSDHATREEASEREFRYLTGRGLQRIILPITLSADRFPVQVDDVLGETALQLECEGAGCQGLLISVRSPDGRGTVVRLDIARAFPVLWIKNPTMYKQRLELNIDRQSARGHPILLRLSQWRFYLWAQ